MDFAPLLDLLDEAALGALLGALTGAIFGFSAQRSSFCLRAATVEVARREVGPRMAVWLLTFSTAVVWVQAAILAGLFDPSASRVMSITGSWSGAVIGGLMFGIGMVLARGCSGRLLVLASTGNLRSLISGLIFAVVAQMALHGWLAPARSYLAAFWTTPAGQNVDLLAMIGAPAGSGLILGLVTAAFAVFLAIRRQIGWTKLFFAAGVGFAVAVGWIFTFSLAQSAFEPVTVNSLTFSGPSASTLMFLLTEDHALDFEIGLIPGVVFGAFLSALLSRQLKFEGFTHETQLRRSMLGAVLMGFGAMLAGGCAIGAGVTGGSVFAATAWLALFCMWVGAVLTDFLIDQSNASADVVHGLAQTPVTNR